VVGRAEGVLPHLHCCNLAASSEGARCRLPVSPYERERTKNKTRGEDRAIRRSKMGATGSDDFLRSRAVTNMGGIFLL
jgi:hypothetical protein